MKVGGREGGQKQSSASSLLAVQPGRNKATEAFASILRLLHWAWSSILLADDALLVLAASPIVT
jgi:hypothetical protein